MRLRNVFKLHTYKVMGLECSFTQSSLPSSIKKKKKVQILSISHQFSSVAQLCLTLCDPMDCSTPGFPVHHQLLKPTQTHVH